MGFGDWLKGLFGGGGGGASSDACMACDATDLVALAPEAYRCAACGYEGGDGYAAFLADKERATLRELDVAALEARALAGLGDARLTLLAALGGGAGDPASGGWEFTITVGDGGGRGGALAGADEEERARMQLEREGGIAKACAECVALTPTFDVLAEKGAELHEERKRLAGLAASDPPGVDDLKRFISEAARRLEG